MVAFSKTPAHSTSGVETIRGKTDSSMTTSWTFPTGGRLVCIAILVILPRAAQFAAPATEWGVYWDGPRDESTRPLAVALEEAGSTWVRSNGSGPKYSERTVEVWWPGATPVRAPESPGLVQTRLATDLWTVYWQARTNSPARRHPVAAIEIGNEPDLHFTLDLPDRMAATLKAAWLGLKSAHPDLVVLMPSLAAPPGPYARQLVANRILNYTDGWNFHFYGWAQDFGASWLNHKNFTRRNGAQNLPFWITEYGFADFPAGPLPAAPVSLARQRTFFESTTLQGAILGSARQFAFCVQPFVDGALDMGLLGRDGETRPALTAWLELIKRLRVATPLFQLRQVELNETVGWVFRLPSTVDQSEVWWTVLQSPFRRRDFELPDFDDESRTPPPASAPWTSYFEFQLSFPPGSNPLAVGLNGEHGAWSEPALHFNASAATNLHLLTPPRRFEVAGCRWERISPKSSRTYVPRELPGPVVATLSPQGRQVDVDNTAVTYRYASAGTLELGARFYNFGSQPVTGRWSLHPPPGWRLVPGEKLRGQLRLPAFSDKPMLFRVEPRAAAAGRPEVFRLNWRDASGKTDVAEIQLRPAAGSGYLSEPLSAQWQPAQSEAEWAVETFGQNQGFRLVRPVGGTGGSLILGLPVTALRSADTRLSFGVRLGTGSGARRRRIELITPEREVFRWGADPVQEDSWQLVEARVGDFTPAFWSHVGAGDPLASRFVRVSLLGLMPGESVELTPITLIQPGR